MAATPTVDLARLSQAVGISAPQIETVIELLDGGNTVPFITRYRKDQTGGLDEEQIRQIQQRVVKTRLLYERQQTILRSIESQGKLTPELSAAILAADTTKRLEDLYLPYKPKKTTLATQARDRGLEPLALEILQADSAAADLDARAKDFVDPDKKVQSPADALLGAGHILAEMFAERAELRGRLREIFERSGTVVTSAIEPEVKPEAKKEPKADASAAAGPTQTMLWTEDESAAAAAAQATATVESAATAEHPEVGDPALAATGEFEASAAEGVEHVAEASESMAEHAPPHEHVSSEPVDPALAATGELATTTEATASEAGTDATTVDASIAPVPAVASKRREKKKKKPAKPEGPDLKAYRDYFNFRERLFDVPPHRVLAINRGERAKALRVKIEFDAEAMYAAIDELVAPADHPHAVFLRGCGRDALDRLVLPSLEREVRRELTDMAEAHAVQVFARNLRNLLLQPPVRGQRVLAVDPGYKSGCKLVALDEFGNVLEHGIMFFIGKEERRNAGRAKLIEMVRQHNLNTIVIGNGTGCRETERLVSHLRTNELADLDIKYVIVNEAGASVYSTSRIGREEFPDFDATVRGGVSIGRRLLDPLSELVKIEPPSLGVGMYQHDVKAKHLRDSLDAVVESCVNYVGVELNTASPALLRYVSGLNQLTAQRLYDYRQQHGPFQSREQLKSVSGIGDTAFVQSAGFLKISGGSDPLDTTWIHPESYPIAAQILSKLECTSADLLDREKSPAVAERIAQLDVEQLSRDINVGTMTLRDILTQLARPGRDPREALPPPICKTGILKLDDLTPGMELDGTVLNVVDFGAFVDIGLKDSGLVHISQLADRYIQEPHEVVAVGDIVKVWVLEVDKQRRRVSLTMLKPGTKREHPPRREQEGGQRPPRGERRPPRPPGEGRRSGRGGPPRAAQPVGAGVGPEGAPVGEGATPVAPQHSGGGRPGNRPPRGNRPPAHGNSGGPSTQGGQGQEGQGNQGAPPAGRPGGRSSGGGGRPGGGGYGGGGPRKREVFGQFGGGVIPGAKKKKDHSVASMLTSQAPAKKKKSAEELNRQIREGKSPMRTFGDLKQFLTKPPEEKPGEGE